MPRVQDSKNFVEFDEFVEYQLEKTRQGVRWTDIFSAGAGAAALILGYLLLFILADHWLFEGGVPGWLRVVSFLVLAVLCVGWVVYMGVRPLFRRINDLYAARMLEQAEPGFRGYLLGLIDLRRAGRQPAEEVRRALEKRSATMLSEMDLDAALDRRDLMRIAMGVLAIVILLCGYAVFSPKDIGPSLIRALAPGSNLSVATRTKILNVNPKDTMVLVGATLDVSVRIRGERPQKVWLYYTTEDQRFVDQPVEMMLVDKATVRYEATLIGDNGRGLRRDFTYRIEAGDATTRPFQVTIGTPPVAQVTQVALDFPDYTERPSAKQTTAAIEAVEGTRVELTAKANRPLSRAAIQFAEKVTFERPRGEIPLTLSAEGTTGTAQWTLMLRDDGSSPSFYRFICQDKEGGANPNPTVHSLRIHADLPPKITLHDPQGDIERPANAIIPLLISAHDQDYELREITLHYSIQRGAVPGGASPMQEGAAPAGGDVAWRRTVLWEEEAEQAELRHKWSLESLDVEPGEVVVYYLQARDNKEPEANRTNSPKLRIHITESVSEKEAKQQLAEDIQRQNQKQKQKQKQAQAASEPTEKQAETPSQQQKQEQAQGESAKPGEQGGQGKKAEQSASGQGDTGQEENNNNQGDEQSSEPVNNDGSADDVALRKIRQHQLEESRENQSQGQEQNPQQKQKGGPKPGQHGNQGQPQGSGGQKGASQGSQKGGEKRAGDGHSEGEQSQAGGRDSGKPGAKQGAGQGQHSGAAGDQQGSGEKNQQNMPAQTGDVNNGARNEQSGAGEKGKPGAGGAAGEQVATADPSASGSPWPESAAGEGNSPVEDSEPSAGGGNSGQSDQTPGGKPSGETGEKAGAKGGESSKANGPPEAAGSPQDEQTAGAGNKENAGGQSSDNQAKKGAGNAEQSGAGQDGAGKKSAGAKQQGAAKTADPQGAGAGEQPNKAPQADGSGERSMKPDTSSETGPGKGGEQTNRRAKSELPGQENENPGAGVKNQRSPRPMSGEKGAGRPNTSGSVGHAPGQGNKTSSEMAGKHTTSAKTDSPQQGAQGTGDPGQGQATKQAKNPNAAGGGQQDDGQQRQSKQGNPSRSGESGGPKKGAQGGESPSGQRSGKKGGSQGKGQGQSQGQSGRGVSGKGNSSEGGAAKGGKGGNSSGAGKAQGGNKSGSGGGKTSAVGGGGAGNSGGPKTMTPQEQGKIEHNATPANEDYTRQTANLVLKELEEDLERGEVDPELLKELGWTKEDMQKFAERLQSRLSPLTGEESAREKARRQEFQHMLENMTFQTEAQARTGDDPRTNRVEGVGGINRTVPLAYREAYKRFTRSISGLGESANREE